MPGGPEKFMDDSPAIGRLLAIMDRLRDPQSGCAWDLEQTFRTIAPHTIEESYEVAEAIEKEDWTALKVELGDLLFQAVFHARLASEQGLFHFDDVVEAICDKMVRRHPHVFGDDAGDLTAAEQTVNWEDHKERERRDLARTRGRRASELDGIGTNLPALTRAEKIQHRVARVGFGLSSPAQAMKDVAGEIDELGHEMGKNSPDRLEDELGDVLFAITNLARHLGVNPESALRRSNTKFEARYRFIESRLACQGREIVDCVPDELHALWTEAKS